MNLLPELKTAWKGDTPTRLSQCALAAVLSLHLSLPALAEKVEAVQAAKISHPENGFVIIVFTILNYVAGIAILAAVVFCGIWFFQRKADIDDEEAVEVETFQADQSAPAPAADAPRPAADAPTAAAPVPAADPPAPAADATVTTPVQAAEETKVSDSKTEESKAEESKVEEIKISEVKIDEVSPESETVVAEGGTTGNESNAIAVDSAEVSEGGDTNSKSSKASGKKGKNKKA